MKSISPKLFLANLISRVFDPLLIVPLLLLGSTWIMILNGERIRFLLFLGFLDLVIPGLFLVWLFKNNWIKSGWDIKDRKERLPLFIFVVFAHLIGVMFAWYFREHPISVYLTSFWILTVIYAVITNWWKISIHVGVISTVTMYLVLTQGIEYLSLYLLVGVVMWARVVGKYHRLNQVLAGAVLPMIILPLVFLILETFL
jgi:hypothetical protein